MLSLRFRIRESRRLSNGMYAIYLAVIKSKDVRFINTGILVPDVCNFPDDKVVGLPEADNMNARLDYIMKICKDRLRLVRRSNYTCKQIKDYLVQSLEKGSSCLKVSTLGQLFDFYMAKLREEGRTSTEKMYIRTKEEMIARLGDIAIANISQMDIKRLIMSMRNEGLTDGGINMMMKQLKSLLRFAANEGFVIYKTFPFQDIRLPKSSTVFRDLSEDDFIRLKNHPIAEYDLRFVRDMFLLSFYLGGMQMQDLKQVDLLSDKIIYISSRNASIKKYKNEISFLVPPEAREIIKRYTVDGEFVWPVKSNMVDIRQFFKTRLKRLSAELELDITMTVQTPGKTFSQFGCMVGVENDVLRHCVGLNVDFQSPIYNYVKVVNSLADKAIRRVIDYITDYEKNSSDSFYSPLRTAL